jgi:hypothetical protein
VAALSGVGWLATDQGDYAAAIGLWDRASPSPTPRMTWSQRDMHCSIEPAPRLEAAGWRRVAETPRMRSTC